jgi:hypothetical protein
MQIIKAKKVHGQTTRSSHSQNTSKPNLKIVNILFLLIYFVICGKDYIEMIIKFELQKRSFENS